MAEYRYPLETTPSPFDMALNPGEVYDHSGLYIYRILPTPIEMIVTFSVTGLSYVEVFNADNNIWLLGEKVEILETTSFTIGWDGTGVFEPRVWKGSLLTGVRVEYTVPDIEVVAPIPSTKKDYSWVAWAGAATAAIGFAKSKGVLK